MATKRTTGKTAEEAPTKKAPAKKAPAKKSSPSSSAEGAPAKKTATRRNASSGDGGRSAPRAAPGRKRSGMVIAREAAEQLGQLTGRDVEGVTALERTEDGWRVEVEVLEVRRIPETTDVLATYELTLDDDGDIEGYRRLRRYVRGTPGEEQSR
jgi:hypothetical protein